MGEFTLAPIGPREAAALLADPGPSGTPDILPDSRLRVPKGVIRGGHGQWRGNWEPVFCAVCGCACGYVLMTADYAFTLCDPHDKEFGPIMAAMWGPQQRLWEQRRQEQLAQIRREIQKGNRILARREAPRFVQFGT